MKRGLILYSPQEDSVQLLSDKGSDGNSDKGLDGNSLSDKGLDGNSDKGLDGNSV